MVLELGIGQSLAAPNYRSHTEVQYGGLSALCGILWKVSRGLTLAAFVLRRGCCCPLLVEEDRHQSQDTMQLPLGRSFQLTHSRLGAEAVC